MPNLFHSVLSLLLNCGLLSPEFVVDKELEAYDLGKAPINSVEGFIRQIIGWREYMYGMYINYSELKKIQLFRIYKKAKDPIAFKEDIEIGFGWSLFPSDYRTLANINKQAINKITTRRWLFY